MTIVPMAALPFTFGASGMLAGLAFASLPIIIHLLHRRRFKEIEWAAMEWLLEAIRKRARRLRLEQWLLLAVRTMLIALVVLAMAKMTLGAGAGPLNLLASAKPVTHMVLVFDNSLSMHYAPGAASRWERAKKIAHQALEDAGAGDLASAVLLGPQPAALVKEASPNLVEVGKEIDGIRPQHGEGKLEPAIEIISSMLKSSRAARKRVVLITDMQRTTFASADGKSEGSELGKKLIALNSLARDFTIVDVGEPKSANSAVVHLEQVDPLGIVGQPTRFRATLAHFGDAARTSAPVELLVEGQRESVNPTTIEPGRPATVEFSHVFRAAGDQAVEVRIGEDALKPDDARRLGVRVREALKVLLVDGQPSGEFYRSETDYLRDAVELSNEDVGTMQPTVRPESELLESKLDDWDAVLLCNVQQFTPAEAAALREYLARGGGVGFFLGSHVNAAAYNQVLYDNGKGILPVRLMEATGDAEKTEKAFHFDPLGYKHPIAASFADNPRAGLLTANIFRYFRLEIPKEFEDGRRPPAVALGFQGTNDPAIVIGRSGRGKVAVIATGADMDWNRWAPSTSYLPVIKKLVNELAASDGQRAGVTVGETLAMPLPRQGFDVTANLTIPGGGGIVPLKAEERDGVSALVYPNPEIGGVYSVAVGPPVSATWKYAVNTPPSESDLARWSDADLKSLFPGWQFSVRERWGSETAPSADGLGDDASVHPFLLWAALLLVFLETLLAWRCGHHG